MKFSTIAVLGIAAQIAGLIGPGPAQAQDAYADSPSVTWRVATYPPPRVSTTAIEKIAEYVDEKTGGKFHIDIGYGTYGDPRDFLDLLQIGSIQGALVQTAITGGSLPLYTVLDLPFLPLADGKVQREVHEAVHQHPAVIDEFAKWNAMPFMSSLIPQYQLIGRNTPPEEPADLAGWKVRAQGELGRAVEQLGATVMTIPAPEVYVAFDRGLVDAVAQPFYAIKSYRLAEIGSWMTSNLPLGTTGVPFVLSKSAWEDLPQDYRDLLLDAKEHAYAAQTAAMDAEQQSAFAELAPKLQVIEFSEEALDQFRDAGGQPIWSKWVTTMEAAGLPGQEILDLVLSTAEAAMVN